MKEEKNGGAQIVVALLVGLIFLGPLIARLFGFRGHMSVAEISAIVAVDVLLLIALAVWVIRSWNYCAVFAADESSGIISRVFWKKSGGLSVAGAPLKEENDSGALIAVVLLVDVLSLVLSFRSILGFPQPIAMSLLVLINVLLIIKAVLRAIEDWGY